MLSGQSCPYQSPRFPKIVPTFSGMREQQKQREAMRLLHALPPVLEDSVEVVKNLRAASPPASAADLIEQQTNNASRRSESIRRCIIWSASSSKQARYSEQRCVNVLQRRKQKFKKIDLTVLTISLPPFCSPLPILFLLRKRKMGSRRKDQHKDEPSYRDARWHIKMA